MGLDMLDMSMNVTISKDSDKNDTTYSNDYKLDSTYQEDDTWFDLILNSHEWKQIKLDQSGKKKSNYRLKL